MRILLIDDNDDIRIICKHALLLAGHDVALARGGIEGLALAKSFDPQLILLDLMMPRFDGFEVLDRLRASPPSAKTPIVVLSAMAGEKDRSRALQAGADAFLTKPSIPLTSSLSSSTCPSPRGKTGSLPTGSSSSPRPAGPVVPVLPSRSEQREVDRTVAPSGACGHHEDNKHPQEEDLTLVLAHSLPFLSSDPSDRGPLVSPPSAGTCRPFRGFAEFSVGDTRHRVKWSDPLRFCRHPRSERMRLGQLLWRGSLGPSDVVMGHRGSGGSSAIIPRYHSWAGSKHVRHARSAGPAMTFR